MAVMVVINDNTITLALTVVLITAVAISMYTLEPPPEKKETSIEEFLCKDKEGPWIKVPLDTNPANTPYSTCVFRRTTH